MPAEHRRGSWGHQAPTKAYRQEQINGADMETQYGTYYYYDRVRAWV
ncbi:hypothetical protein CTE05_16880 [Cellulomonas terrae]|uniref:Uncharacterized protein n=1 Tax=Cellulomonas terrae TaxID=311234 RepID=A0A511JJF9_9CELL|nr:hypothetical protein CTE05_16880 [Cellulomonas terrae]